MQILHLQWERGTTNSIGDRKLTFSADRSIDLGEFNPFKIEQGTQFVVILIPVVSTEEAQKFTEETPEQTKERFRKHMNSLINQVAELKGVPPEEWRKTYKEELTKNGVIKKSTTELDLAGYATVIADLKKKKHELEN